MFLNDGKQVDFASTAITPLHINIGKKMIIQIDTKKETVVIVPSNKKEKINYDSIKNAAVMLLSPYLKIEDKNETITLGR